MTIKNCSSSALSCHEVLNIHDWKPPGRVRFHKAVEPMQLLIAAKESNLTTPMVSMIHMPYHFRCSSNPSSVDFTPYAALYELKISSRDLPEVAEGAGSPDLVERGKHGFPAS